MNPSSLIGVGLVGLALYLYLRPGAQSQIQSAIADAFGTSAARAQQAEQEALRQQAIERQQQTRLGGTITSAGTAGISAIGLTAGATAALTAGVTLGAGLLVWGIVDQGWFRGGWEGIQGNALRDRFIDQFVQIYYPGAGSERQFDAMIRALSEIGIVGGNAEQMIGQLYTADNSDKLRAAIESWARAFSARGITIATPTRY